MDPLIVKVLASIFMIALVTIVSYFLVWAMMASDEAMRKQVRKDVEQELKLGLKEANSIEEVFEPIDDRFEIIDL
jgi:Tfp pilus assembly protein PilO